MSKRFKCEDPRPLEEHELWDRLGHPKAWFVEERFCMILQLVRMGAILKESDPRGRLQNVLLIRGRHVTFRMLQNYVNTVGYGAAHPDIVRQLKLKQEMSRRDRQRSAKKAEFPPPVKAKATPKPVATTKPVVAKARPKVVAGPTPAAAEEPTRKRTSFRLGDEDLEAALLAYCTHDVGDEVTQPIAA